MMAGKFLSICFALCTVALDAINIQIGLHRHGAGTKTCQEVAMENFASTMSTMGQSLLQSASVVMERYDQSPTADTDLMRVNTEAEEQAAPVHKCGESDWQGMVPMADAVCEKGSESEQLIMSGALNNATNRSQELLNKTASVFMTAVKGSFTAEQKSACKDFDPKKFMGFFGPNFNAIEECAKKILGFTSACASCMSNFAKDMIGTSTFSMPFSCGMKCVKGMKDPGCQSCALKHSKTLGVCMSGESYETELPKELKAVLSA